jgi:hypothetical protein
MAGPDVKIIWDDDISCAVCDSKIGHCNPGTPHTPAPCIAGVAYRGSHCAIVRMEDTPEARVIAGTTPGGTFRAVRTRT